MEPARAGVTGDAGSGDLASGRSSRREQRRLQHLDLSRNQLLDAAEEVFGRKGFHDATLREVVEVAEFSVGSLYSFFQSKDDLFRQVFQRRGEEYMPRIAEVLDRDAPAADVLDDLVAFEVGYFREHRHFGRLWLRYASSTLQSVERLADEFVLGNYHESMRRQAMLFERGQRDGVFVAGDPVALARLFSGLVAAFQSIDPAIVSDDPQPRPAMALEELQGMVARTFVR